VIDPTPAALRGLATRDAWTPAYAFVAGAAASFSPCVAPRMLAVAALCTNRPVKGVVYTVAIFTAGVVAAYSVLAVAGTLLWKLIPYSGYLYAALAAVMAAAGILALAKPAACDAGAKCDAGGILESRRSMSATFLLGASSAAAFSPCCMPILTAAALCAGNTGLTFAWLTVTCFALGHAVPLALAGAGSRIVGFTMNGGIQSAVRVVSGALMLALAGLYFILA
jgi:cytochrome c biogenesis protein CcdA